MEEGLNWSIVISVFLASSSWLISKGWELTDKRRARYAEIASKLYSLGEGGSFQDREKLISELSRLWIEAPSLIVDQTNDLLDLIGQGQTEQAEAALQKLVINMRQDTGFWRLRVGVDKLNSSSIKLRKVK